ncbi:MAG TPA: manganese efflux pump MntP family protein [Bacteroidales bacterium]|nr:manganese efflux pump MntP family protein [Bacteroidales bacterium]
MGLLTILLIAIGLSFDTFAVSISSGLALPGISFRNAVRIAIVLAFFQALMPLIGWAAGTGLSKYVKDYDHWIAFGLLFLLGAKMIYESLQKSDEKSSFNPLDLKVRVVMAIATSIDALIVGISFAFLEFNIALAIFIIGSVTFIVSMLGMLFGKSVGTRLGRRMEIVGGIMLIAIGAKILIEHTMLA